MAIVATAGHVDHGKSTLIQTLTGRDPDRWDEEKERGLTIDLGFAWADIGGHRVGFVDVPGHERFAKNMLAGVGSVDVALFVVAADEGWMPQTEEHMAILDALEIRSGVVALTRVDLVDEDLATLATVEIEEQVKGTVLEGWPVIPVSAVTGTGLDGLRTALAVALDEAGAPPDIGRPRLWVDRAFVVGGAGLVVTGTLVDGSLRRGDSVSLWPGETTARIRSIQSHESEHDAVGPGTRVALNLAGTDREEVPRGTMLGAEGAFATTRRMMVHLSPVRTWPGAVTDRGAHHLHAGTGHWPARIRLLGARRLDEPGPAIITVETPVPLRMADRFVVREVGRRIVVAGGVVLDPRPRRGTPDPAAAKRLVNVLKDDRNAWATALLEVRGSTTVAALDMDTGGGGTSAGVVSGDAVMTPGHLSRLTRRAVELVADFHDANPMRPGMPAATAASALGVEQALLEQIIASPESGLVDEGATIRLASFDVSWTDDHEEAWAAARSALLADGLAVPRLSSLGLDQEHLHAIVRDGGLIVVGQDVAYLPEQIDVVTSRLTSFDGGFTVSEFRDAMGVSRRQAVPLLEWLDKEGWTSRRGDVRTLRRRPTPRADDAPPP
jgi:selenocysteine-specific elongation factor